MKDILVIILTVAGGLGTFLLGMKHLSEGLQAVSGSGLKRFMSFATTNRFVGIATGALSTSIVQSSSIITVMAVGFVSAGIMNLQQAIHVIIGSNIGTTTTAWLVAFAPGTEQLALGAITLGAIMYFFFQRESVHNAGLAVMGLGYIFMGLYWMGIGVDPLKDHPGAVELFKSLNTDSMIGCVKCFVISLVFTAIVQSSSATSALVMTLAMKGILPFDAAASTVFGMNIGTTITAWFAAIGGTTEAKRTALAHTLFNVVGTIILMPLFVPFILPVLNNHIPHATSGEIATAIAIVHTGFNIVTTFMFVPFTRQYAAFVTRLIPAKATDETPHLSFLNPHVKQSPALACSQAFSEVGFMDESGIDLLTTLRRILDGEGTQIDEEHVFHREDVLDNVQREITEFLGKVMTSRLPVEVADRARSLLRLADEYESVSDESAVIVKAYHRLREQGAGFSDKTKAILMDIHDRSAKFADEVSKTLTSPDNSYRPSIDMKSTSSDIGARVRDARRGLLLRLGNDSDTTPLRVLAELDMLNAYDRMRSYYINIYETIIGGKVKS